QRKFLCTRPHCNGRTRRVLLRKIKKIFSVQAEAQGLLFVISHAFSHQPNALFAVGNNYFLPVIALLLS
ncbi:MAG: hypothetical protein K2J88_06230, partial [Oscillospiraceae bacterium]|nr:hypothetical protein [Oscillospiraceae bacterium]